MQNYVQNGMTIDVISPYAVTSGGGCKVGNRFGVASSTVAISLPVALAVYGVFDLAKDTSTFLDGDRVYWNDTTKLATSVQGNNLRIGIAALSNPDTTVSLGGASGDATVRAAILPFASIESNSAAGLSSLSLAHAVYNFAVDGGLVSTITPVQTAAIPANAIFIGATVNPTTAPLGAGASVAIGTSAGSATNSILAATAVGSLTIDALLNGVPTLAAPRKMTAAGNVTFTVSGGALTAGVIEAFVYFVVPQNA
jgi:predicted RecA/RadA family phage recombinase